jgi:hypothetical protein
VAKRATAWFVVAEHTCGLLASPKTALDEADRRVEALLYASRLWSLGEAVVATLHAAWLDSWSRRLIRWAAGR